MIYQNHYLYPFQIHVYFFIPPLRPLDPNKTIGYIYDLSFINSRIRHQVFSKLKNYIFKNLKIYYL